MRSLETSIWSQFRAIALNLALGASFKAATLKLALGASFKARMLHNNAHTLAQQIGHSRMM